MDSPLKPTHRGMQLLLGLIAVAGLAGVGVYYWQQQGLSSTKSSDQAQITDLNSKVGSLTKQLDTANTKIRTLSQPAAPTATTVDDKTVITNLVTADCEAKTGFTISNLNIGILQPPFADVEEGCRNPAYTNDLNPGYELVLKKVGSQWVIITRPTNGIDAATRQNYGIPSSIQ